MRVTFYNQNDESIRINVRQNNTRVRPGDITYRLTRRQYVLLRNFRDRNLPEDLLGQLYSDIYYRRCKVFVSCDPYAGKSEKFPAYACVIAPALHM